MSQDKEPPKRWQNKHFWYSLLPLFITLVAIALFNLFGPGVTDQQPPAQNSPTAISAQVTTPSATVTRGPILRATILPSPTPTITPLPELTTTAAITLLGPPTESSVALNGRLTFYWTYSEPLLTGQQFVFTLRQNDTIISTQAIAAPNLGNGFQLLVDLQELTLSSGTAVWQLHLEWKDEQQPLLNSEERLILLLPE